jgi:hypothetical protein
MLEKYTDWFFFTQIIFDNNFSKSVCVVLKSRGVYKRLNLFHFHTYIVTNPHQHLSAFVLRQLTHTPDNDNLGSLLYTVKKASRFSRPQTGCHLPNSRWPGIIIIPGQREFGK